MVPLLLALASLAAAAPEDIEPLCSSLAAFGGPFDTGGSLRTWTCTSATESTTDPCDGGWAGITCTDGNVAQM